MSDTWLACIWLSEFFWGVWVIFIGVLGVWGELGFWGSEIYIYIYV